MGNHIASLKRHRSSLSIIWKAPLPYLILFVFGTTFWVFMTERDIDLFQVSVMAFCSILYFINNRFRKEDFYIYAIIAAMMLSMFVTSVYNIPSFGYAVMFMLTFLLYKDCLVRRTISIDALVFFLKELIFAYAIVQLLQIACLFTGIPPINMPEHIFGSMRINGLSSEPSHTARICLVIMVAYMYLKQMTDNKDYHIRNVYGKDKYLWICYCFVMLSSTSATAFLTLPFTFLFFVRKRNLLIYTPIALIILVISVKYIDLPAFARVKELVPAVMTMDTEAIRITDNSASSRINPYLYYFKDLNIYSPNYWVGYGKGYSAPMLMGRVLGHDSEDGLEAGGIFPVMFYDYGLIAGLATIVAIWYFCFHRRQVMFAFVWLFFISSGSFSCYYQWLYICLAFSCKRFCKYHSLRHSNSSIVFYNQ